ncbi:MAG: tetratricopeptide repeat protein, partial [Bacteroides sp.]|nr:tetratricopeptide repeat protein [Bacteroides sp.]
MQSRVLILAALISFLSSVRAQEADGYKRKAVMKEINSNIKSENYQKADELVRNAIEKYEEAKTDAEYYNLEVNIQYQLTLAENRKMYLKSNPDTTKYFGHILNMYRYGMQCDSLDALPNEKGDVKYSYRDNISSKMKSLRNNLCSAGKYHYKKKNYKEAYDFLDMYMSTAHSPLVKESKNNQNTATSNSDSVKLSQLAVLSAYASKRFDKAIKYISTALLDSGMRAQIYEVGSTAYSELGDTVKMIDMLSKGFTHYPKKEYFYTFLLKYYNDNAQYGKAIEIARKAVRYNPENQKCWYIKGKIERCLNIQDSAIASFSRAIELKPDDAETYSSIGNIYMEQANNKYKSLNIPISNPHYAEAKQEINSLYSKAEEYYEQARKYDEKNTELWFPYLREIYYKL